MCVCDLDMDYRIFSECIWSFCMRIHMRVLGLQSLLTVFCIIGTVLLPEKSQGGCKA